MKCNHFTIEELVPLDVLRFFGEEKCWGIFDENFLKAIDGVRDFFGVSVEINNYDKGKHYQGFRPLYSIIKNGNIAVKEYQTLTYLTQHAFGRAGDLSILGVPAEIARNTILRNANDPRLKYIRAMEDGVNWLHLDTRNTNQSSILLFKV